MPNFHIEGRMRGQPDVLTNFMWEVEFVTPLNQKLFGRDVDGLNIKVKNISTPSRSIDTIETWFYGLKQNIPGRTTFSNQITMTFEETEDQYVLHSIYRWMERIQSMDPLNPFVTYGTKSFAMNLFIKQIKYNGEEAPYAIELKKAYPISVNEMNLDYSGNDSIRYDVTFNYGYWLLLKTNARKFVEKSGLI
jgi:hypothetical protein